MKNPVIAEDCFIYDKNGIEKWLISNKNSPITGEELASKKIREIHKLDKILIENCRFKLIEHHTLVYDDLIDVDRMDIVKENDICDIYNIIFDLNNGDDNTKLSKIFENDDLIDHLIENVNKKNYHDRNKWMLLHYICHFGKFNQLQKILKLPNINLEAKTNDGWRPIHFICSESNNLKDEQQLDAIKLLIEYGVDLEAETNYKSKPIHLICSDSTNLRDQNQLAAITLLIESNVNLEVTDRQNWKPVHYVCSNHTNMKNEHQFEAIKLLVNKSIDLDAKNNNGWTPMHIICSKKTNLREKYQLDAIKLLIAKGSNFEIQDTHGWKPLHLICSSETNLKEKHRSEALKIFIDNNVDIKSMTYSKKTPYYLLQSQDEPEALLLLLNAIYSPTKKFILS
jgi:hypothetical protein